MTFSLTVDDGFSLEAAASFAAGFPGTQTDIDRGSMRFAWSPDDDWRTARVELHHDGDHVRGQVEGEHDRAFTLLARRDVERILCLDVDASGFASVGASSARASRHAEGTAARWAAALSEGAPFKGCVSRPRRCRHGR